MDSTRGMFAASLRRLGEALHLTLGEHKINDGCALLRRLVPDPALVIRC
jgi:hypothetical protein